MFYLSILSDFTRQLNEIQKANIDFLNQANLGHALCSKTLNTLRKAVMDKKFKGKEVEIHFFKHVKIEPMQYLIYYTEVRSCELRKPKIGRKHQLKYLEKQIAKVNSFLKRHIEFLLYMEQGFTHFDKHYFTREHLDKTSLVKSYPYYKDPMFNTSHDEIWARIKGLTLYVNYLKIKKENLKTIKNKGTLKKGANYISWTGTYAAFAITNSLHYKFDVKTDHQFDVRLYQEYVQNNEDDVWLRVFGLNQLTTVNGATERTVDNGFIPIFGGAKNKNTLSSYFATLDYSYFSKYNLTAGIRRDGSSRFGENFRFGNFYSVGLGWIVSEENFFSSVKAINFLKFRASYGTVGNQRIGDTDAFSLFLPTSYNGVGGIYAGLSNPDLKWEETAKANIGIDMRLLNSRISFNLDVYHEKTTDLFQDVPISSTTGFESQFRNVGSLKNEGIEFNFSSVNIDTKHFKWETGFNIAANETTILELNDGESFRADRFLIEEGGSYPLYNLVKRAGVNPVNGRLLWYDLDGNLTEDYDLNNAVNVGRATPKYFGGFYNTFTSGSFELRASFTFAQGHKIFNLVRTSLDNPTKISRGSVSTNALRFWRNPGEITDIPDWRQISNYFNDSGWLEDASYIKLRNVILSYNLAGDVCKKLNISGLRLYIQRQNIYTWTSFSGLDPENSSTDYVADYPALSTYTLGLDVKF